MTRSSRRLAENRGTVGSVLAHTVSSHSETREQESESVSEERGVSSVADCDRTTTIIAFRASRTLVFTHTELDVRFHKYNSRLIVTCQQGHRDPPFPDAVRGNVCAEDRALCGDPTKWDADEAEPDERNGSNGGRRQQSLRTLPLRKRSTAQEMNVSNWTKTPSRTPETMIVFGSIRMAFESSASKYRTSPALDISPPVF